MRKIWPISRRIDEDHCGAFLLRWWSHGAFISLQVAVTSQFGVTEISEISAVQSLLRFLQCLLWQVALLSYHVLLQGQIWTAARWKASNIDDKLQQHAVHPHLH